MSSLPPNPVPPDYFERFVEQLEGIRKAVELTNTLIPQQAAVTAKELADFYDKGRSARASVAGPPAEQVGSAWLPITGGTQDLRDAAGARAQGESLPPTPSQPPGPQGNASTPVGPRIHDWDREHGFSVEAPEVGGLLDASQWRRYANDNDVSLPGLREGRYSATDILGVLGRASTKFAVDQRDKALTNAIQTAEDQGQTPEEQAYAGNEAFDKTGGGFGRTGYALKYAAGKAPYISLFKQNAARLNIDASPSSLMNTGASLGVSPAGGDVNIGPFGFRTPFNAAAGAGISREWEIFKMRQAGGINGEQARFIFDQLNARGFSPMSNQGKYQGTDESMRRTPSFEHMADAGKWMTQKNPELVNEEYFNLMDKATRTGAASLDSFNYTMSKVPTVAQKAGVSINQLQADMDAVGQAYQAQGGTHVAGQEAAVQFTSLTKLPAALLPGLMQNPFVQNYGMQKNRLMPWEQGLETGPQKAADVSGAVWQMYQQLPGLPAQHMNDGSGFSHTVTSEDRKLAQMHMQFPELDVSQLRQILTTHKTVQARASLDQFAQDWSKSVGRARNNPKELEKLFGHGAGHYGMLTHQMALAGFSPKEQAAVYNAGKDTDKMNDYLKKNKGVTKDQYIATQRFKKIEDIINKKTKKVPSDANTITIKLDPNARKAGFYVGNKNNARAGKTHVNVPFATGPTAMNPGDIGPSGAPYDPTNTP